MNTIWKRNIVIKNGDGSFIISHCSIAGEHLYNVCARTLDPANLYDIAEIAAFWDALPEGDPRKQTQKMDAE